MKNLFSLLVILPMLLVNSTNAATKKLMAKKLNVSFVETKAPVPVKRDALSNYFYTNIASGIYYVTPGGPDQVICVSNNNQYALWIQGDGNLVLYKNGSPRKGLWTSNTDGISIYSANFHTDGRILLNGVGGVWWQGGIPVGSGVTFYWILQDDGNFCRYDSDFYVCTTGTNGGKKSNHNGQFW